MPLRSLLKYLANNERLIQRLADSYPMRKIARACISVFYRTQDIARESLPKTGNVGSGWFRSFYNRFKQNLSEEMHNARIRLKDKQNQQR